ncbi:hypothetical protein PHLCEN_2v12388 [Hermanssonia centrifuga]|uniref:DNA repair protein RAD50 n=1 Tax=Hermanssonia centrifuga TaxID=98765 RepID=A0A2R6NH99_9APHY|nr:hypothetical protein PHLCEN_2v12388 [Hermanssonia centrifuga]
MASLNKLAIRGIRSFDDKQISIIEFFTPVTVIVGHNGSGKTTIIECLKYATTGDQPANTRGGAFIHDPKMANEKEVKAQVKLRFRAANGMRMLAVRNLSVTMKKTGAMTMKTLESILAVDNDAPKSSKRSAISTKCAEMDAEIPHLLGVSKAVLENVIFCHQEDSYWPLSEPGILKKKFDDIFEATRYTKAVDSIKALRKERVADLKTEKERLNGLSREKSDADKLRARITEMHSTIAAKEIEHEELKRGYDILVSANQKFYDSATRFREIYVQVENLQEKKKHYQEELDSARENFREISGTEEELAERLRNFDDHIMQQKRKRKSEESKMEDIEDELKRTRHAHSAKLTDKGQLEGEAKAQEERLLKREGIIREVSTKYQLQGYDHSPLEREKIVEFIDRLHALQKRQNQETDKLQNESKQNNDEYNSKSQQLHAQLQRSKTQKESCRESLTNLNNQISTTEREVDAAAGLSSRLRTFEVDIEEKQSRIQKIEDEMKAANYDERLGEKNTKIRNMELKRDELNAEVLTLSQQAESRARLELKREESRARTSELKNTLDINNSKFRQFVGADAQAETMEQEVERVLMEKERENATLQTSSDTSGKNLQTISMALSNLREQVKLKKAQIKDLDTKIREGLEDQFTSTKEAIEDTQRELASREEELHKNEGAAGACDAFLRTGRTKKHCALCERTLDERTLLVYEKNVNVLMEDSSPAKVKAAKEDIRDWEQELKRVQALGLLAAERDKLKSSEIPVLEKQIQEKEAELPSATKVAEKALERLNEVKQELVEIAGMKQHAISVSKLHREIQRLTRDIASIESDLLSTGSTKTAEDAQRELESIRDEIRTNERERQALTIEKERQVKLQRSHENDLHALQMDLNEVKNQLRDKAAMEKRIEQMKSEVASTSARLKELDTAIADAEAPIQKLNQEHRQQELAMSRKITEAQRTSRDLNMDVDKLETENKAIERHVRDKRGRLLTETIQEIEDLQSKIEDFNKDLESLRAVMNAIDKEINQSGASVANLRENIRVRRLIKDIAATQAKIDTFDMEEAAKAKRNFQEKYPIEKQRETDMQSKYAHIGGELSTYEQQLKVFEDDMKKRYTDIGKKYRDQLIKVKMSDMANDDLEKYAKALDNAIMKYHSLKMEEVNDTMRHLWNKTYQGTDIDGIKISSESEGGATKKSYNYRVHDKHRI